MTKIWSRNGVRFVLASIAVNAAIGIFAIVSGDFSDLDTKILITSLSVTGGAVLALTNLAARNQQFVTYVPEIGAACSVVGFSLVIFGVWDDFEFGKIAEASGTVLLFASGIGHAGLLSRSRLLPQYRIVLRSAWLFAAVLVGMITVLIWASDSVDNDIYPRAMGVVIVLLAATTLAVPVLHRASQDELRTSEAETGTNEVGLRHCPNCGSSDIVNENGQRSCRNCGARFTVSFSAS